MNAKKVLNHSAILSELKSNFVEKNKGRNYSNNGSNYVTKINTLDKPGGTIKTIKHNFINDKTFYASDLKDKKNKENNFQNNKIDIKISINNFAKHQHDKKIDSNSSIMKDSLLYKPKSNISISRKNDSIEGDSLLQNVMHGSMNNLDKNKFRLTNPQQNSLKYGQTFANQIRVPSGVSNSNSSNAFNTKLRNNYTSTSHPPIKTEANGILC